MSITIRILSSPKDEVENDPMYTAKPINDLYHVTLSENLKDVFDHGLISGRDGGSSTYDLSVDTSRVYFYTRTAPVRPHVQRLVEQAEATPAILHLRVPGTILQKLDPRQDALYDDFAAIAVLPSKKLTSHGIVELFTDDVAAVPKQWRSRVKPLKMFR